MNIRERVRGALRRVGKCLCRGNCFLQICLPGARGGGRRERGRTWLRSLRRDLRGRGGLRGRAAPAPHNLVPKPTPANLRRFAETPVARRAINVIKDRIVGMRWRIQPRRGRALEQIPDGARRIEALDAKLRGAQSRRFVSLADRAGAGGCDCWGFGAIELDLVEGMRLVEDFGAGETRL
jgi:hypothetical protein